MKEKRSLSLLFLLIATPLVTIAIIPAHLWVLFNIVLFTLIIAKTYNMENKEHAPGKLAQCGLLAGIICFETVLWGGANFILANTAVSNADLWQAVAVLAASCCTAIGAFLLLGKRLHRIQED